MTRTKFEFCDNKNSANDIQIRIHSNRFSTPFSRSLHFIDFQQNEVSQNKFIQKRTRLAAHEIFINFVFHLFDLTKKI